MSKTLKVLIEIEVKDMTPEELAEAGFDDLFAADEDDDQEPEIDGAVVDDYSPSEIADLLPSVIKHPDNEMFAGSGIFVNIGDVRVIRSEWAA